MVRRRRKDKIAKKSEIEQIEKQEESTSTINDEKQQFLERLKKFEEECEKRRKLIENKIEQRDRRVKAEITDQKRKEQYLAAVEKLQEDSGRE